MRNLLAAALLLLMLAAGCAAPAMRPAEARRTVLADPAVAAWFAAHCAPAVLEGLSPRMARAYRRYEPAMTVDLVKEGMLVKLEAKFGPEPRHVEAVLDPSGNVLSLKHR